MYQSGYCRTPLFSQIFSDFKLSPTCRAIFHHCYEQSRINDGMFSSSAREIAGKINTPRKKVLYAQAQLKKAGLIGFPSEYRYADRPYFVALKILDFSDGLYTVTLPWDVVVSNALKHGLIKAGASDIDNAGDRLFTVLSKAPFRNSWARSERHFPIFTQKVADINPETILYGNRAEADAKKEKTEKTREAAPDLAVSQAELEKIGAMLQ